MRNSLVTRLTLLIATIIVVAFATLLLVFQRSTSNTYVETQVEVQSTSSSNVRPKEDLAQDIERAYLHGRWSDVQKCLERWGSLNSVESIAAIVVDNQFEIVATSDSELAGLTVTHDEDGMVHIVGMTESNDEMELVLSAIGLTGLVNEIDGEFGNLLIIPWVNERQAGDRFARQVWRSAALWLILTMAAAMTATAFVLRRSLRPINELTKAARTLQTGNIPPLLKNTGDAEFGQLINAFNSASQTIAQTEKMRKQLISDIAHELRTPLTNIKGQLEAAESGLVETDNELLTTLRSETGLLERLVDDFQQLALSDAGQLRINSQSLPLKELLQNILAPFAVKMSAQINFDIPEQIFVQADEERMKQVFGNLMENASQNHPVGLTIHVDADCDDKNVRINFADNGCGIDKEHQPFIFDRFYRAEKSRNRNTGGSGLGLAIVQALIEAMGGTIRYVDDTGEGADFEILLRCGVD